MKTALILSVLLLITLSVYSQSETAKIWSNTYNSGMRDIIVESAPDNQGNIYAAGYRSVSGSMEDSTARILLLKYSGEGQLLWAKTFNSRLGRRTVATGLTVDATGNPIVCGYADTNSFNFKRALLVKYDSVGDTLWARYNGFYLHSWIYHDVKTDETGNVFVSYELVITIPTPGRTSSVVKYSNSGMVEWNSQGVANTTNPLVEVNKFGSVFMGSITTIGGADIKITNFDNAGTQQWASVYNSPNNSSDTLSGLASDPVSGDLLAFGSSILTINSIIEIQTMKFSSGLGQLLWVKRTNGTAPNAFNKIHGFDISPAGDVYICGQFTNNTTGLDGFLIRYNPGGNELYRKIYNYRGGATEEGIYSVDAGEANEPCIAGNFNSRRQTVAYRYSATGGITWRYETNDTLNQFNEMPAAVLKGLEGQIFVVNNYSSASLADVNVTFYNSVAVNHLSLCRSTSLTLPPGGNAYDTINVTTGTNNLVRLEVVIDTLVHPAPKDLTIKLRTPHNTIIELFRNSGLNVPSTGLYNTVLSDTAQRHIDSGSVTYTGYFAPYEPLEPVNSYSPDGSWVLMVNNANISAAGLLKKWCLRMTIQAPVGIQQTGNGLPENFSLKQNYPNPFNPSTNISFALRDAGFVKLTVFDLSGRSVETPLNQFLNAGTYNIDFNAGNLSSGVYFYRLETVGFSETRKMILVK